MIFARKYYEEELPGPPGRPGVKSVGLRLEAEDGWHHERIVSIEAGSEQHEPEQLGRAVKRLIASNRLDTEWQWA